MHWTTGARGYLINDGEYSFRNPANRFAWPPARLTQVASALTPPTARPRNETMVSTQRLPVARDDLFLAERPSHLETRARSRQPTGCGGERPRVRLRLTRSGYPCWFRARVRCRFASRAASSSPWHFLQGPLQLGVGLLQLGDRALELGHVRRRAEPRSVPCLFSQVAGDGLPVAGRAPPGGQRGHWR